MPRCPPHRGSTQTPTNRMLALITASNSDLRRSVHAQCSLAHLVYNKTLATQPPTGEPRQVAQQHQRLRSLHQLCLSHQSSDRPQPYLLLEAVGIQAGVPRHYCTQAVEADSFPAHTLGCLDLENRRSEVGVGSLDGLPSIGLTGEVVIPSARGVWRDNSRRRRIRGG